MGIRTIGSRVIIEQEQVQNKTKSGLTLSKDSVQPASKGRVIAVGPGQMLDNGTIIPTSVRVGETVVFTQFSGSPVVDEETKKTYIILNERDILAILD